VFLTWHNIVGWLCRLGGRGMDHLPGMSACAQSLAPLPGVARPDGVPGLQTVRLLQEGKSGGPPEQKIGRTEVAKRKVYTPLCVLY